MKPRKISDKDLERLLRKAELLRDEDTHLCGRIRILELGGKVLVQEQTPEKKLLLHTLPSAEAAGRFVDERLAVYERMWDGCGCKIDYTKSDPAPSAQGRRKR